MRDGATIRALSERDARPFTLSFIIATFARQARCLPSDIIVHVATRPPF
jgi:hypothetical protein